MAEAVYVRVPTLSGQAGFDIDWRVEPGARVAAGQALAHLCGEGRCGLDDVSAPAAGVLVYRWSSLLTVVRPGDAVGVIAEGDGAALIEACVRAEAARLDELLPAREAEAAELAQRLATAKQSLARALLERDASTLEQWLDAARALRSRLPSPA